MQAASRCFIVKIAGACNINCGYCYVYNLGDTTFRDRPKVMSREVAAATLRRVYEYAAAESLESIILILHGGEPLLVGKDWMRWFLAEARRTAPDGTFVDIGLQTNGTLLDREWLSLLAEWGVGVGISLDGPPEWNDRQRVTFSGRGTYDRVRRSIDLLIAEGDKAPGWGVLVVANPEYSGLKIYRHLLDVGVRQIDFLWPDFHHDAPPPWPAGALGDYFIELFEEWYGAGDPEVEVRFFVNAMKMLMGGNTQVDALGPQPVTEVVVEADGSLEPLDVLRIIDDGKTRQGLNVLTNGVGELRTTELFQLCLHNQELLPEECLSCPAYSSCGGGYMPHRWGRGRGFSNPSVHCADLLRVLTHIDQRIQADLRAANVAIPSTMRAAAPHTPAGA